MSQTQTARASKHRRDDYNDERRAIVEYLRKRSEEGKVFFKSKKIARDLGISAKKVGANLGRLSEESDLPVSIERWSQSNATTWKVDPR
ncbi:hypothetical protein ACEU6E_03410 [Halorutilales archaeon Cl-col2-1]